MLGIRKKQKKKPGQARQRASVPVPAASDGPKNGRLALAVAASVLTMIVLIILNATMFDGLSVSRKAFGPPTASKQELQFPFPGCPAGSGKEEAAPQAPPEVTFYNKLTVQNDPREVEDVPDEQEASEEHHAPPAKHAASPPPAAETRKRRAAQRSATNKAVCSITPEQRFNVALNLPRPKPGGKKFTVQVGAFVHPGVARQWAVKWKARGYQVFLRPVARPNTGVIYRLYLGSFDSGKKADELVARLKAKEGISAFRVALRN
ncbi:MAG: SPOR domain-containing protein [Deltaproteobacteria bacterium]